MDDAAAGRPGHEPDRLEPSDADALGPFALVDLDLDLEAVYALGSEGTEPVDWASLVPDRTGMCPDCGQPDGPRHMRRCIAHPRPPSAWWMAVAVFVVPAPLVPIFGPGILFYFTPLLLLGLYLRAR